MLQSVLLASIEKGQFVIAILGIVAVVMLLKMRSADVAQLALRVLDVVQSRSFFGYVFGLAALMGWRVHVRWLKHSYELKLDRWTKSSGSSP
jgi:hypothetical protein